MNNKSSSQVTSCPDQTEEVGRRLASSLDSGTIVCLVGGLGAGKTTFVKGLARGLGVRGTVVSPSYLLLREYDGRITLYHIDLFRISTPQEFIEAGLDDYLLDPGGVVAIEWAERIGDILPEERIEVKFKILSENRREISVNFYS